MNANTLYARTNALRRAVALLIVMFSLLSWSRKTTAGTFDWANGWTRCPSPSARWSHLAISADASVIAALGSGEEGQFLALSKDFGRTWRSLPVPPEPLPHKVGHFSLSSDGTFLALAGSVSTLNLDGTWDEEGVLMTLDDLGTDWKRRQLPPELAGFSGRVPEVQDLALSRDGSHMLVAVAGHVCLSQDRGLTWRIIRSLVEGGEEVWVRSAALSADGTTLAVGIPDPEVEGGLNARLLLSTDSGATWNLLPWHGVEVPQAHEVSRIELGGDGRRIVAVLGNRLLLSNDHGQSWRSIPLAGSNVAVSSDGTHILSAPYNRPWPGIFEPSPLSFTADSGATWQTVDLGWVPLVAISDDGSVQVGAEDSGGILINGVVYPPTVLDTRLKGDLGLIGDRSVTLGVEATGGSLKFQWRRDGVSLTDGTGRAGSQGAELRLTSVSEAELGTYSVVVSNAAGTVEREVGTLKLDLPSVSTVTQLGSVALVEDSPVTFQVTATGGLLSYQWQRNGVDLDDAPGRTGSRTPELKLVATAVADLGAYSVVVSNSKGFVVTNAGELKLTVPRVVATQPSPGPVVIRGDYTRLQVRIEGGQTEVEWLLNGLPLGQSGTWNGPGTNALVLANVQSSALGQYAVRLRNPLGETVAEVARVTEASWSRANLPTASWNSVAISGTGERMVVSSPDGVVASGDGGEAWEIWSVPGTDWTSVALGSASGRVILGQGNFSPGQGTSGYTSADWGGRWTSWVDPRRDRELEVWRTQSAASSADGRTLFISQDNTVASPGSLFPGFAFQVSRLRISHDGGLTWRSATSNSGDFSWRSVDCSADGRVMAAVRGWAGGGPLSFSVECSDDSGNQWRWSSLPERFIRAVRVSADGHRLVAIAGDHLYGCDVSDLSWHRLAAPSANWTALCLSADGRRIFAADYGSATGAGVIHQSDDGGQMWRWSGSPSAKWTAIACSADGERVIGVSPQGIFLAPDSPSELTAVPLIQAGADPSGIRLVWRGTPHRTHRLISTRDLGSRSWRSAGAMWADAEGRVFVTGSANEPQRFWQALEEGEPMAGNPGSEGHRR